MRRVEITRTVNIDKNIDLSRHPNVRKNWSIPGNYALFEFYDPIYEKLDDPNCPLSNPTKWTDDTRLYMSHLVEKERAILSPLYQGRPRHWQGNTLGLPLQRAMYRVLDSKRLQWPWFGCLPGWELETSLRVRGRLEKPTEENEQALAGELARWAEWASSTGELLTCSPPTFVEGGFETLCSFSGPCGDVCMSLYIMLTLTRRRTSLLAVGFAGVDRPDVSPAVYMRFGARGLMKANGEILTKEEEEEFLRVAESKTPAF
jgi:hypothetical protein